MRMFLLFILLFIQLPISAKAANCGDYNNPFDAALCVAAPGCMVEGGACNPCAEGHYCPQNATSVCNSTNGACDCPAPFTATQTTGATSWTDCRIKVDTCTDGHHVADTLYIKCNSWSNSTSCSINFGDYTPQRSDAIIGGITYDRWAWPTPTSNASGLDNLYYFIEEGYHLELQQSFSATPTPALYTGDVGPISFTMVCVPNSVPCSTFRNFTDYENSGETFNSGNSTHVAQFNTVFSAPPEDVGIGSVTIHGTNCPVGSTIQNNAEWDVEQNKWDVHDCKCVNSIEHELSDRNCIGYGYQNADTSKDVFTIQENVIYDTEINDDDSYCIRCIQDTTTTKYFVANKDLYHEGYDSNTKKVSECQAASTSSSTIDYRRKGRYRVPLRPNYCNSTTNWVNGNNAPGTELEANPCPRVACTAIGTTTSELLPIKEADTPISQICVYGSETTICDTDGETCIPLQDVGSLPLSDWQMLP